KWLQVFVCGAGAVVTGLHVVNKGPPHDDAEMWLKSGREHVCTVSVCAIVGSWTGLSFAIRFNNEAAEVRDQFVDLIGFCFPPCNHRTVERIRCRQVSDLNWSRKACREIDANSVGTKDIRNGGDLFEVFGSEYLRIRI